MNGLARYLVAGGFLIAAGVGLVAYSTALSWPLSGGLMILGVLGFILGLLIVIDALVFDLSVFDRKRSEQVEPTNP